MRDQPCPRSIARYGSGGDLAPRRVFAGPPAQATGDAGARRIPRSGKGRAEEDGVTKDRVRGRGEDRPATCGIRRTVQGRVPDPAHGGSGAHVARAEAAVARGTAPRTIRGGGTARRTTGRGRTSVGPA